MSGRGAGSAGWRSRCCSARRRCARRGWSRPARSAAAHARYDNLAALPRLPRRRPRADRPQVPRVPRLARAPASAPTRATTPVATKHGAELACRTCHSEHNGRPYRLVRWPDNAPREQFDHRQHRLHPRGRPRARSAARPATARSWWRRPRSAPTRRSPVRRTYLGLATACASCHLDEHRGRVSRQCQDCHTQTAWKPAPRFDHATTRFPLTGKHADVRCDQCHEARARRRRRPGGRARHVVRGLPRRPARPAAAPRPATPAPRATPRRTARPAAAGRCEPCHTTRSWFDLPDSVRTFDHAAIGFTAARRARARGMRGVPPAGARGAAVRRQAVLVRANFLRPFAKQRILFDRCDACHADVHEGQLRPRAAARDCAACHTEAHFAPDPLRPGDARQHRLPAGRRPPGHPVLALPSGAAPARGPAPAPIRFRQADRACMACHRDEHGGQFAGRTVPGARGAAVGPRHAPADPLRDLPRRGRVAAGHLRARLDALPAPRRAPATGVRALPRAARRRAARRPGHLQRPADHLRRRRVPRRSAPRPVRRPQPRRRVRHVSQRGRLEVAALRPSAGQRLAARRRARRRALRGVPSARGTAAVRPLHPAAARAARTATRPNRTGGGACEARPPAQPSCWSWPSPRRRPRAAAQQPAPAQPARPPATARPAPTATPPPAGARCASTTARRRSRCWASTRRSSARPATTCATSPARPPPAAAATPTRTAATRARAASSATPRSAGGRSARRTRTPGTRLPDLGVHASLRCEDCHRQTGAQQFTGRVAPCVTCHQSTYNATTEPAHATMGLPTQCEVCHQFTTWSFARFPQHDGIFPVYSGAHAGVWRNCLTCHTDPTSYRVFVCTTCHTQPETDPRHQGIARLPVAVHLVPGVPSRGPAGGDAQFHEAIFPINSGTHAGKWTACADCHTDPSNYGVFSCMTGACHAQAVTDPGHRGIAGYQYTATQCRSCHPDGRAGTFAQHDADLPDQQRHARRASGPPAPTATPTPTTGRCSPAPPARATPRRPPTGCTRASRATCTRRPSASRATRPACGAPSRSTTRCSSRSTAARTPASGRACAACHTDPNTRATFTCTTGGCHAADGHQRAAPGHPGLRLHGGPVPAVPPDRPAGHVHAARRALLPDLQRLARRPLDRLRRLPHDPNTRATFSCMTGACHPQAATNANHTGISGYQYVAAQCRSCHPDGTAGTFTEHDAVFPINSGTHLGKWSACSDCHTNPANRQVFSCMTGACHAGDAHHRHPPGHPQLRLHGGPVPRLPPHGVAGHVLAARSALLPGLQRHARRPLDRLRRLPHRPEHARHVHLHDRRVPRGDRRPTRCTRASPATPTPRPSASRVTRPGLKGTFTQHDALFFPIYSGRHSGRWNNDCVTCHPDPNHARHLHVHVGGSCHPQTQTNSNHYGRPQLRRTSRRPAISPPAT